ncbi:hypothetical protein GALL_176180 [mine drainage metagenome]|uniref:Uncharacterized protein n=1 Tax=mine drainage metagenome TaxID=410659 RepID=A0A1J5S801_9ZZZZ
MNARTRPGLGRRSAVLSAILLAVGLLGASPAFADGWRDHGWHHDRDWHDHDWHDRGWRYQHRYFDGDGYYAPRYMPPPMVVAPPPPAVYMPPPVVMAPPAGINLILPLNLR